MLSADFLVTFLHQPPRTAQGLKKNKHETAERVAIAEQRENAAKVMQHSGMAADGIGNHFNSPSPETRLRQLSSHVATRMNTLIEGCSGDVDKVAKLAKDLLRYALRYTRSEVRI